MTALFDTLIYQIRATTGNGTASTGYRLVAITLLLETVKEIKEGVDVARNFYFLEHHPLGQVCMELLGLNPEVVLDIMEEYRNGDRWEPAE